MKKSALNALFLLSLSAFSTQVIAAPDLVEVFNDAYENDPVFQSAIANYLAAAEVFPQKRAALLPNINLTANTFANHQDNQSPSLPRILRGNVSYNSHEYTLNLTQPLLNVGNWTQLVSAYSTVKQSLALTVAAYQDLIIRVAKAYFAVLQKEDNLGYTQAQKRAVAQQLDQAKERYKVGVETITAVYEAQAKYDSIVAQEIGDKNNVANSLEDLRHLTRKYYKEIAKIKRELPLLPPQPENMDAWVDAAARQNFTLQGARFAADAARTAIKTAFAGHFPTINAVATHDYTRSGGDSPAIGLNTTTDSLGLQLNLPIFQGGLVLSQTRQAQDTYAQLRADMENAYLDATVKTRQNYNNVMTGISQVKADRNAVLSAQSTVDATLMALKVGTRNMLDLLQSQTALYKAQQTMSIDQYTYIIATLTLKQQVGTLNARDITAINSWLRGQSRKMAMVTPYSYQPVPANTVLPLHIPAASAQTMSLIDEDSAPLPKLPPPLSETVLPSPPAVHSIENNRQLVPNSAVPKSPAIVP
ncbi:TolC family outer membrane protein [soil metagenome]